MSPDQTIRDYKSAYIPIPPENSQRDFFAAYPLEDFSVDNVAISAIYCRRDFYKVILIKGDATYYYSDRKEKLIAGQYALLFTNRNMPYRWEIHSGVCEGYGCIFNYDFLHLHTYRRPGDWSVFSQDGQSFFHLNNEQANVFLALFKKMIVEQQSLYQNKQELIFLYLLECIHGALKLAPVTEIKEMSASTRLYESFQGLLSRQFPIVSPKQQLKLRTAQDIAIQLHVHVNYLNRSLKAFTGKTTTQLLTERIIQEARALLLHTDLSVSQISYSLGFEEPTHFTYFFHKHAGITPSDVRQV